MGAEHPRGAFAAAAVDEAAARLAAVLDEEDADVVVGYDWHGGYGHPDHIRVHHAAPRRRARRATAASARVDVQPRRDAALRRGRPTAGEETWDLDEPMDDGNPLGEPESAIHWRVDVGPWLERRRASLQAHSSQTTDVGMMLSMPPEVFATFFGHEHYIEPGREPGMVEGWPFGD